MKTIEQTSIKAGSYYTIAAASGCVIEYVGQAADGAQLRLGKYQHKPEQEWSFVRVGDNAYRIHCRANNKVVDLVAAGTGRGTWLHLWDDVMGSSQVWVLTRNNDGTVQISSPWASGKCVDTVGMGSPEGAILQIWDKTPRRRPALADRPGPGAQGHGQGRGGRKDPDRRRGGRPRRAGTNCRGTTCRGTDCRGAAG